MIPTKTFWEDFLEETQDGEKEYIRYLSKDIAFLKELKEDYQGLEDWETEQLISAIIHDEIVLMDACKRRWLNAQRGKKESEGIQWPGSNNIEPRDANLAGSGNIFMDKSQIPDAEP